MIQNLIIFADTVNIMVHASDNWSYSRPAITMYTFVEWHFFFLSNIYKNNFSSSKLLLYSLLITIIRFIFVFVMTVTVNRRLWIIARFYLRNVKVHRIERQKENIDRIERIFFKKE